MRRRILIRRRIILKIDVVKRKKGNFRMKTSIKEQYMYYWDILLGFIFLNRMLNVK